ncbi:XrtA/PEP-CTERM system TPR-repeat protein PrsT [Motilimonas pumila]|uniref:PEP-CTERM system TPR-repeat protein PrsT n=1 Tax=Motilimonas pumila TaxID=2303987 RepID=A0A418YIF1_9GAMM|nr:XrtA/PEP-CTERM system TPR-repeat protein PrsT [Motilimonas pumila]RJG50410.1 PEP-CTERM system TPR-repeat protein PrsT [Motilimonas pumila]
MNNFSTSLKVCLLASSLWLVACGEPDIDPKVAMEQGINYQQQKEHSSAIIAFKNVIKADPKSAKAKALLADSYSYIGMYPFAEKELSKAIQITPSSDLALKLAKAQFRQGKHEQMVTTLADMSGWSAEQQVDGHSLLAQSYLLAGNAEQAQEQLLAAKALAEPTAELLFASALHALAFDDIEAAEHNLEMALEKEPELVKAMILKGELLTQQGEFAPALAIFEQVEVMQYGNPELLINSAKVLLAQENPEAAAEKLDKLLKVAENHPQANYLKAFIYFHDKQYQEAKQAADSTIRVNEDFVPAQMIAAYSAFHLAQYENAYSHINKVLYAYPHFSKALKLKSAIQFKLGESQAAAETMSLIKADDFSENDTPLLKAAGRAFLADKQYDMSQEMLRQAEAFDSEDNSIVLMKAQAALNNNEISEGIEYLKQAEQQSPKTLEIKIALVLGYIQNKDLNQALKEAKQVQADFPQEAVGYILAGVVYFVNNQLDESKAQFTQVMALDPNNATGLKNLAAIAIKQQDVAEAKKQYLALLEVAPNDPKALLQLYRIELHNGNESEALPYLQQSVKHNPKDLLSHLALIEYHFFRDELPQTLALVEQIRPHHSNNVRLLFYNGVALTRLGRYQAALPLLDSFVAQQPKSFAGHYYLASANLGLRQYQLAAVEADKALELNPNSPPAAIMKINILLALRQLEPAKKSMVEYLSKFPANAKSDELQARIALIEGDKKAAISLYQASLKKRETNLVLIQLANAYWSDQQYDEAQNTLKNWLVRYPGDYIALNLLTDFQMVRKQNVAAIGNLLKLREMRPDNALIENNLAWLYQEEKQLELAREHADTAYKLDTNDANILDTLGYILLQQGEEERAERLLLEANKLDPTDLYIQYHLAQALIKNDKKQQAKTILEAIVKQGKDFEFQQHSEALLQDLPDA